MTQKPRSGRTGVSWHAPLGKWRVYGQAGGKARHIGYFHSLEDAKDARDEYEYERSKNTVPVGGAAIGSDECEFTEIVCEGCGGKKRESVGFCSVASRCGKCGLVWPANKLNVCLKQNAVGK